MPCRLDQVGQQLLLLVLTEFALGKIVKVAMVAFNAIVKGRKYRREVFMVPVEMVSTLCVVGRPS